MSLNVVHLSTLQAGGAATAAYRLHQGLRQASVQSTMLVLAPSHAQSGVEWVRYREGEQDRSFWPQIVAGWRQELGRHPSPAAYRAFHSFPAAAIDLSSMVESAPIIHLHWVAGMVAMEHLSQLSKGAALVWTLHDANPFTGGCHYPQACRRYEQACHHCPQLGPRRPESLFAPVQDAVAEAWCTKQEAFRDKTIHVGCPSRWILECSSRSRLLGGMPHHHIPYGLDLEIFQPVSRWEARCRLGLEVDCPYVLFGAADLGDYRKGMDLFTDAMHALTGTADWPQFKVLTFGVATITPAPDFPIEVVNLGGLGSDQLRLAYAASNVFVIPTREDNLPNTCLESLACGTPVVGFNVGGLTDAVTNGETGELVAFPDTTAMAAAIAELLTTPDEEALRRRCRGKACSDFALDKQAHAYIGLYNQILAEKERA